MRSYKARASSFLRKIKIISRNPSVFSRIAKNYLSILVSSTKPLRTADITFGYHCNFNCQHCYAHELEDKTRHSLTFSEMISGIDACLDEGAIHFNIIGGEPTLYDKLFDVISYIHTRKALVSLATNGFLLDKNYVGMLKRYKVDVILISLDYLDAEAHDSFTKLKGSFSRVIEAIDNCISVGLTVFVSTVLTNERLHNNEFKKILEFCGKKKIICHINLPTLFGRWKKRKDLLFSAEDIEIIKSFYRFPYLQSCETNAYFFPGCSPGLEKLHITSYGDVLPCAFIPINFGNILLEPLGLIRQRMHGFSFFNAYNEMCVPSTNKKYYEIFDKLLSETEKLPINFKVFDKVYRQSLL